MTKKENVSEKNFCLTDRPVNKIKKKIIPYIYYSRSTKEFQRNLKDILRTESFNWKFVIWCLLLFTDLTFYFKNKRSLQILSFISDKFRYAMRFMSRVHPCVFSNNTWQVILQFYLSSRIKPVYFSLSVKKNKSIYAINKMSYFLFLAFHSNTNIMYFGHIWKCILFLIRGISIRIVVSKTKHYSETL